VIKFVNLTKSFGKLTVLRGISFEIKKGEVVFILGTSGTGKSVLLKSIVGLLTPTTGEVWVDGENVAKMTEEELLPIRKKCGMVFQHPALFDSLTVYENIAYGLRKHFDWSEQEISDRVLECLRLVHLGPELMSKLPTQLSYGMQKRVSLARTVAIGPEILLFDEPTTGLDPITTNAINELILDLSRGLQITSLVVSHDMVCALGIADRIIVLDQGWIVEKGSPDEIRASFLPLVQDFLLEVNT
jgi:phospholipid/cholesterol/gamma-HCH transport system ATP-binding protein